MRLIDATELETKLLNMIDLHSEIENPMAIILLQCATDIIRKMPVIKAEPVRHGEWINNEEYDYIPCCSFCGQPDALSRSDYSYRGGKVRDNNSNYCPNCGVKMDGGERSD